ncbi:hypothetical protein [Streptomyces sioyaensis]|nr:hypothetical protein [Streptomyces sioyaensis]
MQRPRQSSSGTPRAGGAASASQAPDSGSAAGSSSSDAVTDPQ